MKRSISLPSETEPSVKCLRGKKSMGNGQVVFQEDKENRTFCWVRYRA